MLNQPPRKILRKIPSRNIALKISMAHYEISLDRDRTLNDLKHDMVQKRPRFLERSVP